MNPSEEHDELWQLLGKARTHEPSAFFARNVVREVRASQGQNLHFVAWLSRRWQFAAGGVCAVALAIVVLAQHRAGNGDQVAAIAVQVSESPDYLVIRDLDDLLASEESSLWLD